ncbi:MAG: SEC-C metal-binding domain-containing protein [Acidimicrobiales bacterium]|nr:SEC-C metal-binding domain-containing protein [Acidimicrobiales bacterium]
MSTTDLDERIAFAFPTVDVAASGLDPLQSDERFELVQRELGGLGQAVAAEPDNQAQAAAAQILLGLRDALSGMIVHDEADVWSTVVRLRDEGFDDERIHRMLLGTAVDHLMPQMADPDRDPEQDFDAESFVQALAELPDDPHDLDDDWEDGPLDDLEWQVDEWLDSEQPDHDLEDDIASTLRGELHDELMAAVGDDFTTVEALVDEFAPRLPLRRDAAQAALGMYLEWYCHGVFVSPEGQVATDATLVEGIRFRHVLTEAEAATERLAEDLDIEILFDGPDPGSVEEGPLRVTIREAVDGGESTGRHVVPVIEGPEGWLGGASAGDEIAVTRRGARIEIEDVSDQPGDPTAAVDALSRLLDEYGRHAPIDIYRLFRLAAVSAGGLGTDLGRPLTDLLAEAGWSTRDEEVAPEGFDWDAHRDEQRRRGREAVMARAGVEGPEMVRPIEDLVTELFGEGSWHEPSAHARPVADDRVRRVAGLLAEPGVAQSVFTLGVSVQPEVDQLESVLEVARSLVDRVGAGGLAPGPARLALLAASALDRIDLLPDLVKAADLHDVADPGLCTIVGDLELDRGNLEAAHRAFVRGDVHLSDMLLRLLIRQGRAFDAGRNDPCPCGSGRKFKRCHASPAGPPVDDVTRARLLIARLERHDRRRQEFAAYRWHRLAGLVVDEEWLTDDASMFMPLLETLAWFEGGGLADYLESRGALLPEDDRAVAESWLDAPISVGTMADGGVELTDGRVVSARVDLGGFGVAPFPGSATFGRLLPVGGELTLARCAWPQTEVAETESLLREAGDDPDAIATAIGRTRQPGS